MSRILHVDDNPDDLELVKGQLLRRDAALQIDWAESAKEALTKIGKTGYGCIICDYQMPEMDGLELLKTLRHRGDNTPFIFLTGQGNEEVAAEALRSGCDDYFTKETAFALYDRLLKSINNAALVQRERESKQEAEEALRTSEKRYRQIVETAEEGIWSINRRGVTTFVNKKMAEMLGYSIDEMLGKSVFRFMDDEWKDIALNTYLYGKKLLRSRNELRLSRKDGSELWTLVAGTPVLDDEGRLVGGLGMLTDITELKRAAKTLRESEEKYRSLFETSKDMVYITTADGKFLDINQSGCDLTGYSKEELLSIGVEAIYENPGDREVFRRAIEKSGYVKEYPLRIRRKDGSKRDIVVTASVQRDKDGEVIGYHGIIRDVTDHKRAEEVLKYQEEKYRNLFNFSNDMIFLHDLEGRIIDVNKKVLDNFGYSKAEILSSKIADLHPTKALAASRQAFEKITKDGFVSFEIVFKRKNGELFDAELSSSLFEIGGKKVIQGIARDVTERRRAREALEESEERYRSLVERANDVICIIQDGIIKYANPQVESLIDYSVEELLGTEFKQYVHTNERPVLEERYRRRMAGEDVPPIYDTVVKHKNGSDKKVEINAAIIQHGGKPAILAFVRDTTERKKHEEALRRERDLINRFMETSPVGITVVDREGKIQFANQQAEVVLGLEKDEITQRTYDDPKWKITDYDGEPFPDEGLPFRQVMRTGQAVYGIRHALEHPDGQRILLSVNAAPLFNESGDLDGMVAMVADVTEIEKSAKALRENEERYRAFINQSTEGIWRIEYERPISIQLPEEELIEQIRDNAVIAECNATLAKMYGYSRPEELIGVRPKDLQTFPESVEKNIEGIRKLINSGFRVENVETEEIDKEGNVKYFMNNVVGIIAGDHIIGEWGTQKDITESRLAGAKLRAAEERYRDLVEKADIAISLDSEEGNITYFNNKYCELFGYRPEEMRMLSIKELVHPDDLDMVMSYHSARVAGKTAPSRYEFKGIRKDGAATYLEVDTVAVHEGAKIIGTRSYLWDITERRRDELLRATLYKIANAATQTADLKELYKSIHEFLGELLDTRNFYIALQKEGGLFSFPYCVDEFDGTEFSDQELSKSLTAYVFRTGKALLADERTHQELIKKGEVELVGTSSPVWLGVPLKTDRGVIGVMAVQSYTDADAYSENDLELLTFVSAQIASAIERKRAEEMLKKSHDQLAAANKELEAFSYSVSHDLRAPLRRIDGYVEMLQQEDMDNLGEKGRTYVNRIRASSEHMSLLIAELLKLSQISRTELKREFVDLTHVAGAIAGELQSLEPDREVGFEIASSLPTKSDAALMRIVLENLLGNAWKFSSKIKKGKIEFGTKEVDGKQVFYVRDNGPGFDISEADRLFMPFQRLHGAGEFEGSGVGLATVQRIINLHGGIIWAESEEGKGATFLFTLE